MASRQVCVSSALLLLFILPFSQCRQARVADTPPLLPTVTETEPPGPYLLIDSNSRTLQLRDDGKVIREFSNIAFGVAGVHTKHHRGDGVTPIGQFRIGWLNPASKFRKFIGLDFPSMEYAERALAENVINQKDYEQIKTALDQGKTPSQRTPLGGLIGIHGLGSSSLKIHQRIDWTDGCVALDNDQIDSLFKLAKPGMLVVIR